MANFPNLEETTSLSSRVAMLREFRNMTLLDLAKRSHMSIKRVESIESGEETWLSISDRQVLAKALGVEPRVLKEVELSPANYPGVYSDPAQPVKRDIDTDDMAERVLKGEKHMNCPRCGTELKTSIETAYDTDGNETKYARGYCPKCPFALR